MRKSCFVIFDPKARTAFENFVLTLPADERFTVVSGKRLAAGFARRHPDKDNPYRCCAPREPGIESGWDAFITDPLEFLRGCYRVVVFRTPGWPGTGRSRERAVREECVIGLALKLGLTAEIAITGRNGLLFLPAPAPESAQSGELVRRWMRSARRAVTAVRPQEGYELFTSGFVEDTVNCSWEDVERALEACIGQDEASDGMDRFCVLELSGTGTYVQTAFQQSDGAPSWRIEWRRTFRDGAFRHFYGVERTAASRHSRMAFRLSTVKKVFREFMLTGGECMSSDDVEWHEMRFTKDGKVSG